MILIILGCSYITHGQVGMVHCRTDILYDVVVGTTAILCVNTGGVPSPHTTAYPVGAQYAVTSQYRA